MNPRNRLLPVKSRIALAAALSAMAMLAAGCGSNTAGKGSDATVSGAERGEAAARKAAAETQRVVAQLDRDYVVGPTAAGEINYRIAWQYQPPERTALKGFALRGDSVFTLDQNNYLTRIIIADGQRRWRTQAADEVLDVTSLNVVDDQVYLTAGSQMLVFDVGNGTPLAKWNLERVAGTPPVEYGQYLIYGSSGGDLVWLSRSIGFMYRAYHISATLRVPPVLRGNMLATVGARGEVALLNADTATKFWDKMLLNPVVCRPVIGEELLYLAGQDQYIWGLDLRSGRATWHYFTNTALSASPSLLEGRLYQQVPGTGLLCLNAVPMDLPGGELFWSNDKVTGNVILGRRSELFAWDAAAQRLFVLDSARGLTKTQLDLPQARYLIVGGDKGEEFFAASTDGRVVRLTPRN